MRCPLCEVSLYEFSSALLIFYKSNSITSSWGKTQEKLGPYGPEGFKSTLRPIMTDVASESLSLPATCSLDGVAAYYALAIVQLQCFHVQWSTGNGFFFFLNKNTCCQSNS